MGPEPFIKRVREFIAAVGFRVFLWGVCMTREEYWESVYEQELNHMIAREDMEADDDNE